MTDQPTTEPVNPCTRGGSFCGQHGYDCPPSATADRADLRDRIAKTLARTELKPPFPHCLAMADAVMPVLAGLTLRELELLARPNTTPSRPEPRLPDHTVNEEEAPTPVKQRADCTEIEWAEQERARYERLYTRETVRADLAEARADTAARDAEIYQQRLERLSEGYTEQRKRAEAMERAMESTAADASAHRGCHRDLMAQCLRAERAEAEAERLRADRAAVLREAADCAYGIARRLDDQQHDERAQGAWDVENVLRAELRRMAAEAQQQPDETPDDLATARATNQRLNLRAQQLESELAAYRRAVARWEVSERGTYIPHASLRAIGKACGVDVLGSVRHLKHFERVEQAEAEVRRLGLMVDEYGAGASALTDKLKRARDMHRETCPLAQGSVPPAAFVCGMCEVLDAPAVSPPETEA